MFLPLRKITFTRYNADNSINQNFTYDYVCDIEISKSYLTLTNTCKIVIPRKLIYQSGAPINPTSEYKDYVQLPDLGNEIKPQNGYVVGADAMFRRGDSVKIEIGFYPNMQTRFVGYISKVHSSLPITIDCEDSMWLLKQTNVIFPDPSTWQKKVKSKSTGLSPVLFNPNNVSLSQLLTGMMSFVKNPPKFKTVDDNMDLGHLIINNDSAAQTLQILKDRYGLFASFRDDGVLYVGFGNNYANTAIQSIQMDGNNGIVINNDTLQWTNARDVIIKVRGKSLNTTSNLYTIYEAYMLNNQLVGKFIDNPSQEDKKFSGDVIEQITINQSKAGLKKWVDNMLPTLTYNGWRGDIHTIGEPAVSDGDVIKLTSNKMPERNGSYLVKAVKITDGTNGYFQTISLGIALQNQ